MPEQGGVGLGTYGRYYSNIKALLDMTGLDVLPGAKDIPVIGSAIGKVTGAVSKAFSGGSHHKSTRKGIQTFSNNPVIKAFDLNYPEFRIGANRDAKHHMSSIKPTIDEAINYTKQVLNKMGPAGHDIVSNLERAVNEWGQTFGREGTVEILNKGSLNILTAALDVAWQDFDSQMVEYEAGGGNVGVKQEIYRQAAEFANASKDKAINSALSAKLPLELRKRPGATQSAYYNLAPTSQGKAGSRSASYVTGSSGSRMRSPSDYKGSSGSRMRSPSDYKGYSFSPSSGRGAALPPWSAVVAGAVGSGGMGGTGDRLVRRYNAANTSVPTISAKGLPSGTRTWRNGRATQAYQDHIIRSAYMPTAPSPPITDIGNFLTSFNPPHTPGVGTIEDIPTTLPEEKGGLNLPIGQLLNLLPQPGFEQEPIPQLPPFDFGNFDFSNYNIGQALGTSSGSGGALQDLVFGSTPREALFGPTVPFNPTGGNLFSSKQNSLKGLAFLS